MRLSAALAIFGLFFVACSSADGFRELHEVPDECPSNGADLWPYPDNVMLANEILTESTQHLLFSADERDDLASQIQAVLDAVRAELPEAGELRPRPRSRWQISVELQGPLADELLSRDPGPPHHLLASATGDRAFDELGREAGMKAMELHLYRDSHSAFASLCLSPLANVDRVAAEFEKLPAVRSAGPPSLVGDIGAIDLRKRDDTWFVVARVASGDCPSGCTEETLHFLTVSNASATIVSESEAARDPMFVDLVHLVRGNDYEWPSPSPSPVP